MGQGEPRSDREWEHWPGRRPPEERPADDRIRHRLRSLFTPTDVADDMEAMLSERGQELELRTRQLADAIADLERREESTRRLRVAVEEMLRHGSSELDDRHAELDAVAGGLAERDERLRSAEADVEERRRALGAVELQRAAVERREVALREREEAIEAAVARLAARERELDVIAAGLEERLERGGDVDRVLGAEREALDARARALAETVAELEARVRTLAAAEASLAARELRLRDAEERLREATAAPASSAGPVAHLLLVPGDRYRLEERLGPLPLAGEPVATEHGVFTVLRVGASPYPRDGRPCVFLEPAAATGADALSSPREA